jgi:hypothetical protein
MSRRRILARFLGTALLAVAPLAVLAGTAEAAPPPAAAPAPAVPQFVYGWGALAFSPSTGSVAWANDYPSLGSAAQAATSRCGVRDCQALVEVADGCASMAQASNGALGWAYGVSRSASDGTALRYAHGSHARVIAWVCTTGHQ